MLPYVLRWNGILVFTVDAFSPFDAIARLTAKLDVGRDGWEAFPVK